MPNMLEKRSSYSATLLKDGKVLIVGGARGFGYLDTAEIFDPKTNKFSYTGKLNIARYSHKAVLLDDGRVLLLGGLKKDKDTIENYDQAEIYDPITGKFTLIKDLIVSRSTYLSAVKLKSGEVLIAGGFYKRIAEIYNPKKDKFTQLKAKSIHTIGEPATLLNDGNILYPGGATLAYRKDKRFVNEFHGSKQIFVFNGFLT